MSSQASTNADSSVPNELLNSPALSQTSSFISPMSSQGSMRSQFNIMNTYQSSANLSLDHQDTPPIAEPSQPASSMSVSAAISGASATLASADEPELKKVKLTNYNFFKSKLFADSVKQGMTSAGGACVQLYSGQTSPPSIYTSHKRLEERIGGILCCTVCLDLPSTAIYQVK